MKELKDPEEIEKLVKGISAKRLKIIEVLSDGKWYSISELLRKLPSGNQFTNILNHCKKLEAAGIAQIRRTRVRGKERFEVRLKKIPRIFIEEMK